MIKMELRPSAAFQILSSCLCSWPLLLSLAMIALALAPPAVLAAGQAAGESTVAAILDGRFEAAIVIDADSGETLVSKNPHTQRQPASMLKMMTELIILERIAAGDVAMDEIVPVSARSSRMGGSQVYLKHGEKFSVEQLLQALAIHSANDAAVALAEHLAGSVEAFVDLMNLRAQDMNMHDTVFHSVHGLPPARGQKPDMTSVYDMALLGRELASHAVALTWSSTAKAPFRDGKFIMYNPNKLIGKFRGLDGLKTGYHGQSGYCVTATAIQRGKRLISVVMGAPSDEARATETTRLLSYGFNLYSQVTVIEAGRTPLDVKLDVKGGKRKRVAVAYIGPLEICIRKDRVNEVIIQPQFPDHVDAPITEGQQIGRGVAVLGGEILGEIPIVTIEAVPKGNWLDRLFH